MDVTEVEILRGPQGTLFGGNTTAGLIDYGNKPTQESETVFVSVQARIIISAMDSL